MRNVIRRLEDLQLSTFSGENVKSASSLIRGAVGLLDNNGSLPADMVDTAFKIMKTSSTPEFNTHVMTMRTNHELDIKRLFLDELLMNLQSKYNELSINGEWNLGASSDQAVFIANLGCHSCGYKDHFWSDFPTKDLAKVEQRLNDLSMNQGSNKGRGGARSRRGGGGRGGREAGGQNVFRIPPGAGQPHIRRRGLLTERWCGTCSV